MDIDFLEKILYRKSMTLSGTAQTVYQDTREAHPPNFFQKHPHKKFLFPILEGAEFCRHPELLGLMVSCPFLDAAAAYLGTIPKLTGVRLCWSPENETARSSQLFHFDYEDLRQVKVFINIFETKEDQGPLTFLPADISQQVQRAIGRVLGRVQDERIYEGGGRNHEVKLIGPPGSGAFLDTSRCLHYGSRCNRRDRVVLIHPISQLLFRVPTNGSILSVFRPSRFQA